MSSYDGWIGEQIPDAVMQHAAHWMARLDADDCPRAERSRFAEWLAHDPLHQAAFEELAEVWARLHVLQEAPHAGRHDNVVALPQQPVLPPRDLPTASGRNWASWAAMLLVVTGMLLHALNASPGARHETAIGERQQVALPDGSAIELDAASLVRIAYGDEQRTITMLDGQALFDVARDTRPFRVETALATVTAVGTRFQVSATADRLSVIVIEGLVSVAAHQPDIALTEFGGEADIGFADRLALLGAGQRLDLRGDGLALAASETESGDDSLSWLHDEIVFADEPLASALLRSRRYYRPRLLIADPRLNALHISGRFPTTDPEPLLHYLEARFGIEVDRRAATHRVLRLPGDRPR